MPHIMVGWWCSRSSGGMEQGHFLPSLIQVPKGSPETLEMGSSTIDLLEGNAPPRQSKLCGKLSLMSEAVPWGMEVKPSGSTDGLGLVWGKPM